MKNLVAILAVTLAIAGCQRPKQVNVAQEEAAIRATDAQWLQAVKSRDADKIAAFWADDAVIFPSGANAIRGKAAIRDYVKGALASPGFDITWQAESIVVAASGDLAYETGQDEITFRSPSGQLLQEKNNALVVWKKQSDGNWKAAIDIWTPQGAQKQ
jgi:uncharacterized protein (TIGR02246 family)